jgi:hypothetical protein
MPGYQSVSFSWEWRIVVGAFALLERISLVHNESIANTLSKI